MNCPNGHVSSSDDYCSVCGAVMPTVSQRPTTLQTCPVCRTPASRDAMFCESCGYDYLTGVRPAGAPPAPTAAPATQRPAPQRPVARPTVPQPPVNAPMRQPAASPMWPAAVPPRVPPGPVRSPGPRQQSRPAASPERPVRKGDATKWVAEIWIDPDWHAAQGGPDQLPSPGQPVIVGLRKDTVVIGRSSSSGKPDIDLVTDSGVSRRQSSLVTDGRRWFVEDLGSANGTYVSRVDASIPDTPISGRVEVSHHDRILVGSWTRIVVRPALLQESNL